MSIETLLDVEIEDQLNKLNGQEANTKEYEAAVNNITKLIDKRIDIYRIDSELEDKAKSRKEDNKIKVEELNNDKNNRLIGHGLTIAGIIIPSAITIWGTLKSLKFEEEGTVTTIMGRGFINKLLPKK